ncbi:MAG: NADH-quinone oxidoreductase subunit NuoF [archaeon]|nr:NADH-quinone oxidoreductase subunit NuoF [archaeon]
MSEKRTILICRGTGCNSSKAPKIHELLDEGIVSNNLMESVHVKLTGCHGFCQMGPIMVIQPDNVMYVQLKPEDVDEIIKLHLIEGKIVENLLYEDPKTGERISDMDKVSFYLHQKRFLLEYIGKLNPELINDYIEIAGGYKSLKKVLAELNPDQVIGEVKAAELRGRGGAGAPTSMKWQFCKNASGNPKYIICNGDEGDPGAFMDRSIFESNPHAVIEGMVIGAYAMGVHQGFIYVRAEYPLAIKRIKMAIEQAKTKGFLGENIEGSGFSFDLKVKAGAGAFVCGEETALMRSIEGKRGNPSPRPPYPAVSGLWGKPTNINNVKTWATIPRIFEKGAQWFSSIGTDDSKGTIVIALTGKIKNAGLVEIPMGTTIRKLIFDIGGGMIDDKEFKAIQIGGPSGGCVPTQFLDTEMDYKNLTELGAIMGSGGVIAVDEETCMVELARFFISFTQIESCGKCTPCRVGTLEMLTILEKIIDGKGSLQDLDELERIANVVKKGSLCGLGGTAPNPVLTTLRYFRNEYEAHIKGSCPAKVCKALIEYEVDKEKCNGCDLCAKNCSVNAVRGEKKEPHEIDSSLCIRCGLCLSSCPKDAIFKTTKQMVP